MFSYEKFEKLCEEKRITVRQAAIQCGIATSTVSNWKLGRYEPKIDKILQITSFFNVPLERLKDDERTD